jgi:hypothetical protein
MCTPHMTGLVIPLTRFGGLKDPPLDDDPPELEEDEEGLKQTLVVRMTVPQTSDKWGISICPKDHNNFTNVLYHLNPRQ